jgi:hypothetical protein
MVYSRENLRLHEAPSSGSYPKFTLAIGVAAIEAASTGMWLLDRGIGQIDPAAPPPSGEGGGNYCF